MTGPAWFDRTEALRRLGDDPFDVLVVGGGLTTDVAGFACASYRRNTPYLRIPTTLIGLIDASVSIKVAVNHGHHKNRLGAYHASRQVFLDFSFLKTLPEDQIRNGMAELIKISVVGNAEIFDMLERFGPELLATRFGLAVAAFNRISNYDAAISDYLSAIDFAAASAGGTPARSLFPSQSNGRFIKLQDLRYGENAHQQAALYRDLYPAPGSIGTAEQLQGKELSYNNIADADAAWECVKQWGTGANATPGAAAACVIVKHANPCGVAVGAHALEAYSKAFKTDPTSAFGGIIAFNVPVDGAAAEAISKQFVEVLMAPDFTPEALAVFKAKANVRVLRIPLGGVQPGGATDWARGHNAIDVKRVGSGLLMQTADNHELKLSDLKVVTQLAPTEQQLQDLLFAWNVAKFVKSNAIVFCQDGMTMGVGAGQMSRLDSARIASIKAQHAGLSLQGTAVASDAFFPFRDGLDVVIDHGARCVIQPGGSMRDQEVIDAADERGVAMVFSGVRHFRH